MTLMLVLFFNVVSSGSTARLFIFKNKFTSTFNRSTLKLNGLNTVKTVSKVHSELNDL
jgi:hypothetical protein